MQIGIAGYHASGKTTVFNCLTGAAATTGYGGPREANRGIIRVPDPRIDELSALFKPKKTTYANISFVDLPGPSDGGESDSIDKQAAAELRTMDALVHVARGFGEESGVAARNGKIDPASDMSDFDTDLTLLDLVVLEGRMERLKKERKETRELEALEKMHAGLADGECPARMVDIDPALLAQLSGFQLLSLKPQLVLINLPDSYEASETESLETTMREAGTPRKLDVMSLRGNIECEISQLPPEDQQSFLEDLGLTETARDRFIRSCYAMLDLISFFTVGEDEVRAWTIAKGTPAVQAAGKIHSDLERGFIRAETVAYDDFMSNGGTLAKARDAGKLRLEGKDYVVKDGDILNIRFNV